MAPFAWFNALEIHPCRCELQEFILRYPSLLRSVQFMDAHRCTTVHFIY